MEIWIVEVEGGTPLRFVLCNQAEAEKRLAECKKRFPVNKTRCWNMMTKEKLA